MRGKRRGGDKRERKREAYAGYTAVFSSIPRAILCARVSARTSKRARMQGPTRVCMHTLADASFALSFESFSLCKTDRSTYTGVCAGFAVQKS